MGDLIVVDFVNKKIRDHRVALFMDIIQTHLDEDDFSLFMAGLDNPTYANTLPEAIQYFIVQYWELLSPSQQ